MLWLSRGGVCMPDNLLSGVGINIMICHHQQEQEHAQDVRENGQLHVGDHSLECQESVNTKSWLEQLASDTSWMLEW